jgi:hypothetical protein
MDSDDFFDTEIIRITDIPKTSKSKLVINGEIVDYFVSVVDAKELKTYSIRDFSWNRDLNKEHVDKIYNDLVNMESPHLLGTIKIIHNTRYEDCCIFDGQHRKEAIFKKLSENKFDDPKKWAMLITIEVYSIDCEKIEESKIADYLFCMANKVRIFDVKKEVIDTYLQDIIKAYESDPILSRTINEGVNNVCNKIHRKDLFNSFQKYFKPSKKIPIPEVIRLIKEKNHIMWEDLNVEDIFKGYKDSTPIIQGKFRSKFKKARDSYFFLNLGNDNMDKYHKKWITEIVEQINKN